jgi:hypothetical protein
MGFEKRGNNLPEVIDFEFGISSFASSTFRHQVTVDVTVAPFFCFDLIFVRPCTMNIGTAIK